MFTWIFAQKGIVHYFAQAFTRQKDKYYRSSPEILQLADFKKYAENSPLLVWEMNRYMMFYIYA